jgi:Flp pilus assembly protein TadG
MLSNIGKPMKKLCIIGKDMRKLWSCERGAVAPLVGFCAIMLVGAVAVAVDVGRGQVAQSKLQSALDAAGLAAGAVVSQNPTIEELEPIAEQYLNANFNGQTVDASITDFHLDLTEDDTLVTLSAKASLPTTFMRIFGHDIMRVAARTEITREMKGLEVALVLDVTGSMDKAVSATDATKKITVLKASAKGLMNTLFGSKTEAEDLWISIVPFSHGINVGTQHTGWLGDYAARATKDNCIGPTSGTPKCPSSPPPESTAKVSTRTNPVTLVDDWMVGSPANWYFKPHAWSGCVFERWASGDDVTDESPEDVPFNTFFFPDTPSGGTTKIGVNNWRSDTNGNYQVTSTVSANKDCISAKITPATNQKATLVTAINGLSAGGNTLLPLGAVWGWRLLSPKWRNEWGGDMDANGLPLDYDEDLMDKVMVFMTDGTNEMPSCNSSNAGGTYIMTAYGTLCQGHLGSTNASTANDTLNSKTAQICAAMKEQGIIIYTIVFGDGSSTVAKDLMRGCASQVGYYYEALSAQALTDAFDSIGDSLSNLRVSK